MRQKRMKKERDKRKIRPDFVDSEEDFLESEDSSDESDMPMFDHISRINTTDTSTSNILYNLDKHQKKFVKCKTSLSGNDDENVLEKLWIIERYMEEMEVSNKEILMQFTV